jgi:hypothetical protein
MASRSCIKCNSAQTLPDLGFGPVVNRKPCVNGAPAAAGGLVTTQACLLQLRPRFLGAQAHAVQHAGRTAQIAELGAQLRDEFPCRASFLIRSAVSSRDGRPATAASDLAEEQSLLAVALFVAHAVVPGLRAGEFARAGPFDFRVKSGRVAR